MEQSMMYLSVSMDSRVRNIFLKFTCRNGQGQHQMKLVHDFHTYETLIIDPEYPEANAERAPAEPLSDCRSPFFAAVIGRRMRLVQTG